MSEEFGQTCKVSECSRKVITSCFKCGCLLCSTHSTIATSCAEHYDPLQGTSRAEQICADCLEMYEVDGAESESQKVKAIRPNKKNMTKQLKNSGKEYQTRTNKIISERTRGGSNMQY